MKLFVSSNIALLILVVTTVDASRIFYLPLPKLHPSNHRTETPKPIEETTKTPSSDEFIPSSAIEQEEVEKRGDGFDWESLIDLQQGPSRHRIAVSESAPKNNEQLNEEFASIESMKSKINDDSEERASVNENSQANSQDSSEEPWVADQSFSRAERLQSNADLSVTERKLRRNDTLFIVVVGTCCVVGVVGLVAAAIFWYKIQKKAAAAADAEYPSYGVTGPSATTGKISPSSTMSDRKLAQSAQMFHYQQQRQQMMAQEKAHLDAKPVHSDDSDDEAPGGGDYTVYECPGLAPTGEMEVRNPLFAEPDSSLISPTSGSNPMANNFYSPSSGSLSSIPSPTKEKALP